MSGNRIIKGHGCRVARAEVAIAGGDSGRVQIHVEADDLDGSLTTSESCTGSAPGYTGTTHARIVIHITVF